MSSLSNSSSIFTRRLDYYRTQAASTRSSSSETTTSQAEKISSNLIENSSALQAEKRILESKVDVLNLLYLTKFEEEIDNVEEDYSDFEILDKNIDKLSQRFLQKSTYQEDVQAIIDIQKKILSSFEKTMDRHGNRFITKNHLSKRLIASLEEVQAEFTDPYFLAMVRELQQLRLVDQAAYDTKIWSIAGGRGLKVLDFLAKPRIEETDPDAALGKYELTRTQFPSNPTIQYECFKKWMELLVQKKTSQGVALQNIYEHDVKPIAEKFREIGTALEYFSSLGLPNAIADYKEFALNQFKLDFTRTSKIVFAHCHVNNRNDLSNVNPKHLVVDWTFEEFTKNLYSSCFYKCLKEPLEFDSIFAKIVLFASQAGDAEVSKFCLENEIYMPLPQGSSGSRELYIENETIKKVTIASKALPPSDSQKELLTDGMIRVVQKLDYVKGTSSLEILEYVDKDGNFLS